MARVTAGLASLRYQRLQHFSLDVFREFLSNQRNRRLAAAESRHVRNARKFFRHALDLFRHFFRGNFQFQLAAARCFSHAKILSWDDDGSSGESFAGLRGICSIPGVTHCQTGENSPCNSKVQYRRPFE